ncbi:hypothetical protein [Parasitella parasitica]|uniref:CCHC-type domain-containing protein n=1 Tax=Parasitella parasitica TaxID=35722 RepID=A0A0B7NPB5_9FUNG|nr:hypothetical protein [Parasitella parasitica]
MEKVLSNRNIATFEDLVDEATEHESLTVKYYRKKLGPYNNGPKKSVVFDLDSNIGFNNDKDNYSEVSSLGSVLSNLVNEMKALKISTVEQREMIQQQQALIAQQNRVLQGNNGTNRSNINGENHSRNTNGGQRAYNVVCYKCNEPGHIAGNCHYPPRRQQGGDFNSNNTGSGIASQAQGTSNNDNNEAGIDLGHH